MKKYFALLLIVLVLAGLASCFNDNSSTNTLKNDEVILRVNGENITSEQFKKVLMGQTKIFRVQNTQNLKLEELIWIKNRVLDEVIKNTLLSQEIKNNNISIEQAELDVALKESREGYLEGSFENALKLEGLTMDDWEESIRNKLLTNKLIQLQVNSKVSVGEDELRRYFNENDHKFHKKEQVKALHIMVESEDEIREIQKELQNKQKNFSDLAKEFSLGPEGAQGGDLGYFEAGQMPEEFDNVFKLKKNKVSNIIKTPYGFHLLKVVDKIEERKMSFEESIGRVEKILLQDIQDKAFQDWFLKLKKNSKIEIEYDSLEKIN